MQINEEKTKVMVVTEAKVKIKTNITINGKQIEQVDKFSYLGSTLTSDNTSETDIRKRCGMATTAFGKLDKIWKSKKISDKTKYRLLDALIIPIATYACETWTINIKNWEIIAAMEMRFLRRI
jgi:hypothetical protein